MPAPIKNIDFDEILDPNQSDDTNPREDDGSGLGNGPSTGGNSSTSQNGNTGGNSPKGPYGDTEDPEEPPKDTIVDTFTFIVKTNERGFSTFVNNNKVGINALVRITREQLASEDKRIKVSKEGYLCNEYYIVSMLDDGAPIIENQGLKDNQLLGLNTKAISLIKYVDNQIVEEVGIGSSTLVNLNFTLNKKPKTGDGDTYEEPPRYNVKFKISGEGAPVSILKNGNKNAEFFPNAGETDYEDAEGTKYTISTSDISLYRITGIRLIRAGNTPTILTAEDGETLEASITLNTNYEVQIDTELIPAPLPGLDPQISLVKTDPRKYNINTKSGVPLLIQKNKDVQAITIIVGDDILEFDNFGRDTYEEGNGDEIVGITIPHRVFKKIGQYNVKLFPFSFDDYESQIREDEEPITVTPKEVTPKFIETPIKELPPPPKPEDIVNPYKPPVPNRGGGGGGSGGGQEQFISEEQFGIDRGFGSGNGGEQPGRPNRNLNYF